MTEEEVVGLMESSQTEEDWDRNCNKVKKACQGYPSFWYEKIIMSGLGDRVAKRWNGDMKIRVTPFG